LPLTDVKGHEIEVGSRVAYNLSGGVALGTVERIKEGSLHATNYGYRYLTNTIVYIRPDSAFAKFASQTGFSKMKIHSPVVDKIVVLDVP
jgi:hypothetical protein